MNITSVKETFKLTDAEVKYINRCVLHSSKDLSVYNFLPKAIDNVANFFGNSEFCAAVKTLEHHAVQVIKDHFGDATWVSRARVLSEFVIRCLITRESYSTDNGQFYISKDVWLNESIAQMPIEEVIDRSVFGDGKTLPACPRSALGALIKKERAVFVHDVEDFDNYLRSDPTLLRARELSRLITMFTRQQQQENDMLKSAEDMVVALKKFIARTKRIDSDEVLEKTEMNKLSDFLKDMRIQHKEFNKIVATLRQPVRF